MDVHETDAGLEITAELPGVAKEDVDAFLTDRTLTIKGEKKASKTVSEKDRQISERSYGPFRRVMALPYVPEHGQIEAHMENGVLTVVVPRPDEASASPRKIELRKKG
ncbi:hypothetical protein GCM10011316_26300 [Roseibium aquae]|uniref:SHSP domain-containing protein n=1 Tax=Roseibium aquae TaxID=1323746 RepID=A0A916TLI0_9HYPH|nr:Hsp20/alpha crystallin family protein [Roseibium aquae]GGB53003.1 hypothetical protein GCM10011316_26300 [Roseibium aquae]